MRVLSLVAGIPAVSGHGVLTMPMSRNGGNPAKPADYYTTMYYTAPTNKVGSVAITETDLRTEFRYGTDDRPWRFPGSAPVWSPCGMYCDNCNKPGGKDGLDLPKTKLTHWRAGSTVEVGFGMNTNHGGGYSYRLCKSDSKVKDEACFAANYLEFEGSTSWVQERADRNKRTPIKAKRTKKGIGGSHWTKNPVPNNCNGGSDCPFDPPMLGLYGHTHQTNTRMLEKINIVDLVKIPANLPLGEYILSWRWDCEETTQVWLNCADVKIVGANDPLPDPAPAPSPPYTGGGGNNAGGGSCSSTSDDCRSNPCCNDAGYTCYEKDSYWGGCRESCTPGEIWHGDDPQYRSPWSCKALGPTAGGGGNAGGGNAGGGNAGGGNAESEPESEPESEEESEEEPEAEVESQVCEKNLGGVFCKVNKKTLKYCDPKSKFYRWTMTNCCKVCENASNLLQQTKFSGKMVAEVSAHGDLDLEDA